MKDLINAFITYLQKLPTWARALVLSLLSIAAAILTFFSVTSCGSTTKAVVKNISDTGNSTITISTNNPSSISVEPNTSLKINPIDSLSKNKKNEK